MKQPKAKIMLHQTWAYAKDSLHPAFPTYNNNQDEMYRALTQCYVEAAEEADIDLIIPSGRAWPTARQLPIGDRLTVDGFHGNDMGCFLASCCFYEMIFNECVVDNPFYLPDYGEEISKMLKICAHISVEEGIKKK